MLPTSFHEATAYREVSLDTWRAILATAGESARLNGTALSHELLWQSVATSPPGEELLDALEVIHELGTDTGRELFLSAAADQQVSLGAVDDEPARELAARIWLQSRSDSALAEVLVRARFSAYKTGHERTYREFVGSRPSAAGRLDQQRLLDAAKAWCQQHQMSEPIEVYHYERDGEWRCEVLRGDALRRVLEIKDKRPKILNFRPGVTDHIRYEPATGRMGIATRSPRLLRMYREVLGSILVSDANFFANENVCTLKPLQERGRELFEQHRVPGILRVDVVALRWRRGDRENFWLKGPDCFRILEDLGARLHEGELIEATLSVSFAHGRRGRVDIKAPSRIDIHAGANEHLVEQLLDEVGIRGAFDDSEQRLDLWSLFPWRRSEEAWRRHVDSLAFDRLLQQGALRSIRLEAVTHPDHRGAAGALNVGTIDSASATLVGTSDDPAISLRTLTASDVMGFELDIARVAQEIATALELEGVPPKEVASGVWSLGQRSLAPAISIAVFLASRMPTATTAHSIHATANGAQPVMLVPLGRSHEGSVPQVECRVPNGPYDGLVGGIVQRLNLQGQVPPAVWLREDLILDPANGRAWFRKLPLTKLLAGTHPFKFAVAVARAGGRPVTKADLNSLLSPASNDDSIAKKAKQDFVDRVSASFKEAGQDCPPDVRQIFVSQSGGYALKASARVLS